jgi:hypothetical protein
MADPAGQNLACCRLHGDRLTLLLLAKHPAHPLVVVLAACLQFATFLLLSMVGNLISPRFLPDCPGA